MAARLRSAMTEEGEGFLPRNPGRAIVTRPRSVALSTRPCPGMRVPSGTAAKALTRFPLSPSVSRLSVRRSRRTRLGRIWGNPRPSRESNCPSSLWSGSFRKVRRIRPKSDLRERADRIAQIRERCKPGGSASPSLLPTRSERMYPFEALRMQVEDEMGFPPSGPSPAAYSSSRLVGRWQRP